MRNYATQMDAARRGTVTPEMKAVNIPANGVQGLAGLILGCILGQMLEKTKLL